MVSNLRVCTPRSIVKDMQLHALTPTEECAAQTPAAVAQSVDSESDEEVSPVGLVRGGEGGRGRGGGGVLISGSAHLARLGSEGRKAQST